VAIYELKEAALDGIEGQGYAYPVKTYRGKEYKGVFFADDPEAVKEVLAKEEVEFSGTIYERTKERQDTVEVEVVNVVSAGIGERAEFVVRDKDE
jgi:hypothetical protein